MPKKVPPYTEYLYPLVLLRVNGRPAGDIVERMESFEFHDHIKKVDMAKFRIVDTDNRFANDPRFEADTVWEIRWGYPNNMSLARFMRLKYFEPHYGDTDTTIDVTLMGRGAEMLRVATATNWGKVSSTAIAKKMAARHKLKFKGTEANDVDVPVIQPHDVNDFQFLHLLADRIDFEFFIEGQTLFFRSKDSSRAEEPRLTFVYGGTGIVSLLKTFDPVIKATSPTKVKVSGADTNKGKKNPTEEASSTKNPLGKALGAPPAQPANPVDPDARPTTGANRARVQGKDATPRPRSLNLNTGNLVALPSNAKAANSGVATPETNKTRVKKLAQAHRRHFLEAAVEARAEFIGSPRIRAKATYRFIGIDRRLSGLWYTTECVHRIDAGNYTTSSELKKGAYNNKSTVKSKQSVNNAVKPGGNTNGKVFINLKGGRQIGAEDTKKLQSTQFGPSIGAPSTAVPTR